jgi:hypothetical protein
VPGVLWYALHIVKRAGRAIEQVQALLGRVDGIPAMLFWRIPESGFVRITA